MANLEFSNVILAVVVGILAFAPLPQLERSQTILEAGELRLHLQFSVVYLFPAQWDTWAGENSLNA